MQTAHAATPTSTLLRSQFAFGRQQGPKKSPHHEPNGALWQTSVVRQSYLLSSAALIPFSTY